MNYAIAVGIFIATYVLAFVLPLFLGGTGSVIRLAIFSVPVLLAGPRVAQRFTDGSPLLTEEFRSEGGFLYRGGAGLIWLGHLLFFGSIVAAVYLSAQGAQGVPVGLVTGYAIYPYLVGIVLVELAYRQWSKGKTVPRWKSQRNSVYITVGVVVAAQLTFNLTSDRPVDLLSYSEREALAWGNGYSKEVKRKAEQFYKAEKRMPCVDDDYIDINSLLGGTEADRSKALSIEILDCGQFVATIHRPIDGVADGQLLFVASPGDADAGTPLEWQCFSPQLERIERHTNGRCSYDPSLAARLSAPVEKDSPEAPTVQAAAPRAADRTTDRNSTVQQYLELFNEPLLWENCGPDALSFRLLKFTAGSDEVAAVRIQREPFAGSYKTMTSSSPDRTLALDGFVDERMLARVEGQFETAGFWNLESERTASGADGGRIQLEACDAGRYHSVQRASDDPQIAQLVAVITRAGRLP